VGCRRSAHSAAKDAQARHAAHLFLRAYGKDADKLVPGDELNAKSA